VLKVGDCGFPRGSPLRRSLLRVTLYHCPLGDQTLGAILPAPFVRCLGSSAAQDDGRGWWLGHVL
jgi:hypothetical protein